MKKISLDQVDFLLEVHEAYRLMSEEARPHFIWWIHYKTGLFTHFTKDGNVYFSYLGTPPLE